MARELRPDEITPEMEEMARLSGLSDPKFVNAEDHPQFPAIWLTSGGVIPSVAA